ncbi:hypothetical protein Gotur_024259 [Gossypium turneri]
MKSILVVLDGVHLKRRLMLPKNGGQKNTVNVVNIRWHCRHWRECMGTFVWCSSKWGSYGR